MGMHRMDQCGRRHWLKHSCWVLLVAFLIPDALHAAEESENRRAWELLAGYSAAEALPLFDRASPSAERQLGMATGLLGKYPQTPQNVDAAERLLQGLLSEGEKSEYRAAAFYLLGRIAHIFREERMVEAAHYYRQLREEYPDDQLADSAAVKLAMIVIAEISPDASKEVVRQELEALAVPIHRSARSDFHYLLAEYYMESGDLSAALERLIRVRELGINRGINKADLLVQIGRLAGETGREDVARSSYEDFLDEFPTDMRNYMVRHQLEMMEAEGAR